MMRSLLRAARHGVQVRLLLPARSDVPLVRLLGRSYYGPLLKSGSRSTNSSGRSSTAKVMLIDGERTVVGSANLDQRSFHRNFEINLIIDDTAFSGQVTGCFGRISPIPGGSPWMIMNGGGGMSVSWRG